MKKQVFCIKPVFCMFFVKIDNLSRWHIIRFSKGQKTAKKEVISDKRIFNFSEKSKKQCYFLYFFVFFSAAK